MGRHGGRPLPRPAPQPGPELSPRRGVSTTAGMLVAASAVAIAGLTVFALVLSGVSLLPRGVGGAAPDPSLTPALAQVSLAYSPAQETVRETLGSVPVEGWAPVGPLTSGVGTPFDDLCGHSSSVDPTVAGARVFTVRGRQVLVTVSAFAAGAGAVAVADWWALLHECSAPGVGSYVDVAPGPDAVLAWIAESAARPGASSLTWRRGDVVASVSVPSSDPRDLAAAAEQIDTTLLAALAGRCAELDSHLSDAARSPWVRHDAFTGLTESIVVSVSPSPSPTAPQGVTPIPDSSTPDPLPSISYPLRPTEPVWPRDLPSQVPSPLVPSPPAPEPSTSAVPSRVDDPVGPGCGWGFTGQVKPRYDADHEAQIAQARAKQATSHLAAVQAQWQRNLVSYWQNSSAYAKQAEVFATYAVRVSAVARAWDAISSARAAYALALDQYSLASAALTSFYVDQFAAQAGYDEARSACGLPLATPTPTPLPSATDGPTATASTTPNPSPSPSLSWSVTGSPTSTPSSSVTSAPAPVCPPEVPTILLQTAPTLPPFPTAPPDPTPSGSP